MNGPTLAQLRRYAVAQSLGAIEPLPMVLQRMGFIQSDPIRAPARAQDLILRHRAPRYRAGDLERQFEALPAEEDFFINYGTLHHTLHARMHPRCGYRPWTAAQWAEARQVHAVVAQLGEAHPAAVDAALALGASENWFGGNSRRSTQVLDALHYRGWLRVLRRDSGTRVYGIAPWPMPPVGPWEAPATETGDSADATEAFDALIDAVVQLYAPVPESTLRMLVSRCCYGVPQWKAQRGCALRRAQARLARAVVDGHLWWWPAHHNPSTGTVQTPQGPRPLPGMARLQGPRKARLLAPFDPIVWDRQRFERFWGWAYRFEAYTPAPRRVRGYYALPLLWGAEVIGWGNLAVRRDRLVADITCVEGRRPAGSAFPTALERELDALAHFLGLTGPGRVELHAVRSDGRPEAWGPSDRLAYDAPEPPDGG